MEKVRREDAKDEGMCEGDNFGIGGSAHHLRDLIQQTFHDTVDGEHWGEKKERYGMDLIFRERISGGKGD